MVVAYPTQWTFKLAKHSIARIDTNGVQQVVINVSDHNFGEIFPKEDVEFIDCVKNAGKCSAENDDSNGEDRSKKQRSQSFTLICS